MSDFDTNPTYNTCCLSAPYTHDAASVVDMSTEDFSWHIVMAAGDTTGERISAIYEATQRDPMTDDLEDKQLVASLMKEMVTSRGRSDRGRKLESRFKDAFYHLYWNESARRYDYDTETFPPVAEMAVLANANGMVDRCLAVVNGTRTGQTTC